MKQKQLSPEKYIETKARSLPIYKCLVNNDWHESMMASVIVMRKHANGNVSAGMYLVDLFCLGIKDTFYFFNETEKEVTERLDAMPGFFREIDYNLAHNIIYAGHDFAAEYEIQPHKNFSVTRYILEEDDEKIPLIEVRTGDENGNPHLIVNNSYNYGPALEKLKRNAGEGNYTFSFFDKDFGDEDDFDEDDFDDDDEPYNDYRETLDEIENDFLDFNHLRKSSDKELEEVKDNYSRSIGDDVVIHAEIMMRLFYERKPQYEKYYDDILSTKEFRAYENKLDLHQAEYNKISNTITSIPHELETIQFSTTDETIKTHKFFTLFQKYLDNEMTGFMILISMPKLNLAFSLEKLKEHYHEYTPLIQLGIAAFSMSIQSKLDKPNEKFNFILNTSSPENAFPDKKIHSLHHKIFWVVQSLNAMWNNDEAKMTQYHSLLTVTGIGGNLKHTYAAYLAEWLTNRDD